MAGQALLFQPTDLNSNEFTGYNQLAGFAFGIATPANPVDTYWHDNQPGLFFFPEEGAGLEAGFTDFVSHIGAASGTGRRGLLNADRDAGGATACTDAIFMERFLFSNAATIKVGNLVLDELPTCDVEYGPLTASPGHGIMVLGGNSCEAFCGQFPLNGTTGDQSVTGLPFQPDLVIFLSCDIVSPGGGPIPSGGGGADGTQFMLGVMDANGNQWVGCMRSDVITSGPMLRMSNWYDATNNPNCIAHIGTLGFGMPTQNQLASFVSMNADGFTINLSQAGLGGSGVDLDMNVGFIALKAGPGCAFECGNGVQSDTDVTVSFVPDAMIFASTQNPTSGSQRSDCFMSMGMAGTDVGTGDPIQANVWEGTNSGAALDGSDTDSLAYYSTASAIRFANTTAVGTLLAEADVAIASPGATLNWTTDDAAGRLFGWIAMKTTGVPCPRPGWKQIRVH